MRRCEDLLIKFVWLFTKRGCACYLSRNNIFPHWQKFTFPVDPICIMYACKTVFNVAELHYTLAACLQGKQSPVRLISILHWSSLIL